MSKRKKITNILDKLDHSIGDKLTLFGRRNKGQYISQNVTSALLPGPSNSDIHEPAQAPTSIHSVVPDPTVPDLELEEHVYESNSDSKAPRAAQSENLAGMKDGREKRKTRLLDGLMWISLLGKEASPAFPPVQSVFGGLYAILNRWESSSSNIERLKDTIQRVERLRHLLPEASSDDEMDLLDDHLRRSLNETLDKVRNEMEQIEGQSRAKHFFFSDEYARGLDSAIEDIRDALVEYQTGMMNDMKRQLRDMHQSGILAKLPAVEDASFASEHHQLCLEGTRAGVLETIDAWALDESPANGVFWLSGSAGCGKSTLAQTFARLAFTQSRLGASFFCSRDTVDRSQLHNIFPTLAFQLACRYPLFKHALLTELRENPSLGRESLTRHCEKLVIRPLRSSEVKTIIVVDALDECIDNSPESAFLTVLARYINLIPNVKFFITGRPEPRIRSGFRISSLNTICLKLNDVDRDTVDHDIGIFLRTELSQLVKQRSDMSLSTYATWPPQTSIEALVQKAEGLFIFAATTFKVISEADLRHPAEQLEDIVSAVNNFNPEGRSRIDTLYLQILEAGVKSDSSTRDDYSRLRLAFAGIILGFNPLNLKSLQSLLRLPNVKTIIRAYHSVIHVPEKESDTIRTFHKSFPDFLTDPTRCTNSDFYIDPNVYHGRLTILCLQLLVAKTKRNICDIPRYAMNSDIGDLQQRREQCIGDALDYASRFWAEHLCSVSIAAADQDLVREIGEHLTEFVRNSQLFWLEVLSLAGHLRSAVTSLSAARRWVSDLSANILPFDCIAWLDDGYRFVLDSYDAILVSAMHIYHSALALAPEHTLLRQRHYNDLESEAKLLFGPRFHWDATLRTIQTQGCVECLATSPQGQYLAVAGYRIDSDKSSISIFSANTGECLAIFESTIRHFEALKFSFDGSILVARSLAIPYLHLATTQVWDVQTGVLLAQANMLCYPSPYDNQFLVQFDRRPNMIHFPESYTGQVCLGTMDDLMLGSARILFNHPGPVSGKILLDWQWASKTIILGILSDEHWWEYEDSYYFMAWDLRSGTTLWSVQSMLLPRIAVYGSVFAISTREGICICELVTGTVKRTIVVGGPVRSIAMDTRIAWLERRTGDSWVLRLSECDGSNGTQDRTFEGTPSSSDVAFIPGTTNVVTCSFKVDNWVHLHNIAEQYHSDQEAASSNHCDCVLPFAPSIHTPVEHNTAALEGPSGDNDRGDIPDDIPVFQSTDVFPSSGREDVYLVVAHVYDAAISAGDQLRYIFFLREIPSQRLIAISDQIIALKCSPIFLATDLVAANCDGFIRFWRITRTEGMSSPARQGFLPFCFIPVFPNVPCSYRKIFPDLTASVKPQRVEADQPWMIDEDGKHLMWLPQAWRPGVNRWHGQRLLHASDKAVVRVLVFNRGASAFPYEERQRKILSLLKSINLSPTSPLLPRDGCYLTLNTADPFPGPEAVGAPVCWDLCGNPVWLGRVEYKGKLHPCEINPRLSPPVTLADGDKVTRPTGIYQLLVFDASRMEWIFEVNTLRPYPAPKSCPILAGYYEEDDYVYAMYHGIALDVSSNYLLPGKMGSALHDSGGCIVASGGAEVYKADGWLRLVWRQDLPKHHIYTPIPLSTGKYLKCNTDRRFPDGDSIGPPVSRDADGNGLCIGRVAFDFMMQPCTIVVPASSMEARVCVPFEGKAHGFNGDFELLPFDAEHMEWVPHTFSEGVAVPPDRQPVGGGYDIEGNISFNRLYHALASQGDNGSLVPGKAGVQIGGCSIVVGGLEVTGLKNYYVLCWRHSDGADSVSRPDTLWLT